MHTAMYSLRGTTINQAGASGTPKFSEQFGQGNAPPGCTTLTDVNGAGNGTANVTYKGNDTGLVIVPAGGNLRIDLKGRGGELDSLNKPLSLASVAAVYLELANGTPGDTITVGAAGNASNANLGFNACGSFDVRGKLLIDDPAGPGWPITLLAGNLTLHNPGAADRALYIRVTGTSS